MINTEIPEKREANGAEPEIYMHRTNRVHLQPDFIPPTYFPNSAINSIIIISVAEKIKPGLSQHQD
jgi:hypothetical protein